MSLFSFLRLAATLPALVNSSFMITFKNYINNCYHDKFCDKSQWRSCCLDVGDHVA